MSETTIPKPILFGALGVVALVAAFVFLTKGGSDDPGTTPATTTPTTPAVEPATKPDTSKSTTTKPQTGTAAPSDTTGATKTKVELTTLPKPVQKALDKKKIVTVLFWRPRGVEDREMERVVSILRKSVREDKAAAKNIAIFESGIESLTRWIRITGVEGLSMTPSYIVINKKGEADTQTGFIDGATMANVIINDWRNYAAGRKQFAKIPTS